VNSELDEVGASKMAFEDENQGKYLKARKAKPRKTTRKARAVLKRLAWKTLSADDREAFTRECYAHRCAFGKKWCIISFI
jgi:hypothetical protein